MIPEYIFAVKEGVESDHLDTKDFLPVRGDSRSTGWDVTAAEAVTMRPTETVRIPLGIRCFAPEGWWLELRPRSSTFAKKELSALYGVIDESYEGELLFVCRWVPNFHNYGPRFVSPIDDVVRYYDREFTVAKGERIGQLVPVQRQEMIVKSVTNEEFDVLCRERGLERGAGGLGSTG
jgi:dUTPase